MGACMPTQSLIVHATGFGPGSTWRVYASHLRTSEHRICIFQQIQTDLYGRARAGRARSGGFAQCGGQQGGGRGRCHLRAGRSWALDCPCRVRARLLAERRFRVCEGPASSFRTVAVAGLGACHRARTQEDGHRSIRQIARESGCTPNGLSEIALGARWPSLQVMLRVSAVLGVDVEFQVPDA